MKTFFLAISQGFSDKNSTSTGVMNSQASFGFSKYLAELFWGTFETIYLLEKDLAKPRGAFGSATSLFWEKIFASTKALVLAISCMLTNGSIFGVSS